MINQPGDYFVCDHNGENSGVFDFTTKQAEILSGLSPSFYEVAHYESQLNTDSMINPLISLYCNRANP